MIKPSVLVIEDEKSIRNFIAAVLEHNGYVVLQASGGEEGVSMASSYMPDAVLLDLGLPDIDGTEVLKAIRKFSEMPIIVVSARNEEAEKVNALDSGADDYITKPFGTDELLARIRLAMRHIRTSGGQEKVFVLRDLTLDYEKRQVTVRGEEVHLTPIEYKILALLSRNHEKVLTHSYIIKEVWGPYVSDNQALRVNMANIRRKIELNPAEPEYIMTEVGVGYKLV